MLSPKTATVISSPSGRIIIKVLWRETHLGTWPQTPEIVICTLQVSGCRDPTALGWDDGGELHCPPLPPRPCWEPAQCWSGFLGHCFPFSENIWASPHPWAFISPLQLRSQLLSELPVSVADKTPRHELPQSLFQVKPVPLGGTVDLCVYKVRTQLLCTVPELGVGTTALLPEWHLQSLNRSWGKVPRNLCPERQLGRKGQSHYLQAVTPAEEPLPYKGRVGKGSGSGPWLCSPGTELLSQWSGGGTEGGLWLKYHVSLLFSPIFGRVS